MSALAALLVRDMRLAVRVGGGALMGVLFFLVVVTLMPFALGPDLASEMVLAGQRVLPTKLTAAGYVFDHPDIDTALGALLAPGA